MSKPVSSVTFTICDDEQIIFNGKTYTESGVFTDYLSCDTVLRVRINKHPQQVYVTTASLGGEHGYTWTFMIDGAETTETFNEPGTYEYESPNAVTGCSEIWRLVLNRDETEYHFVETLTLCEGEPFSWHGMNNLTQQGIGSTSSYLVNYKTRTGQDSIYELILTVNPVERTTQVIPFCDSYVLNGKTYTSTTTIVDTAHTGLGCYSIVTYVLQKNNSFERHDTTTIIPGQTLYWHGYIITNAALYTATYTSSTGCDSIYTLGVGMKEDGGTVRLSTRETETAHEVIIEDDGVGFDVNEQKNDGRSHIGMENTKKRLQDMCGGEVIIKSKPGEGTVAKIIIPKKEENKA